MKKGEFTLPTTTRKEMVEDAAEKCTYHNQAWGKESFTEGVEWADEHPCLKLWHTRKELNLFNGSQAYIMCDNFHIVEASYCGGGIGNEPRFTVNGLILDNRQILLWCDRMDLVNKTNWMEKFDEIDRKPN